MDVGKSVSKAGGILNALLTLGFVGVIWLIIYGNLAGNTGFAANTAGANNTNAVINNLTGGVTTFFGFSSTLFTISAIVLLVTILVGALYVVISMVNRKGSSGYSYE